MSDEENTSLLDRLLEPKEMSDKENFHSDDNSIRNFAIITFLKSAIEEFR